MSRVRFTLTILLILSGIMAVVATPASAATGWARCQPGQSCYFSDADGGGDIWVAPSPGRFDLGRFNPPFNDRISSVWNRGGGVDRLYNWVGTWQFVDDVQIGEQVSYYWHPLNPDPRNDITDLVCVDVTSGCP